MQEKIEKRIKELETARESLQKIISENQTQVNQQQIQLIAVEGALSELKAIVKDAPSKDPVEPK